MASKELQATVETAPNSPVQSRPQCEIFIDLTGSGIRTALHTAASTGSTLPGMPSVPSGPAGSHPVEDKTTSDITATHTAAPTDSPLIEIPSFDPDFGNLFPDNQPSYDDFIANLPAPPNQPSITDHLATAAMRAELIAAQRGTPHDHTMAAIARKRIQMERTITDLQAQLHRTGAEAKQLVANLGELSQHCFTRGDIIDELREQVRGLREDLAQKAQESDILQTRFRETTAALKRSGDYFLRSAGSWARINGMKNEEIARIDAEIALLRAKVMRSDGRLYEWQAYRRRAEKVAQEFWDEQEEVVEEKDRVIAAREATTVRMEAMIADHEMSLAVQDEMIAEMERRHGTGFRLEADRTQQEVHAPQQERRQKARMGCRCKDEPEVASFWHQQKIEAEERLKAQQEAQRLRSQRNHEKLEAAIKRADALLAADEAESWEKEETKAGEQTKATTDAASSVVDVLEEYGIASDDSVGLQADYELVSLSDGCLSSGYWSSDESGGGTEDWFDCGERQ